MLGMYFSFPAALALLFLINFVPLSFQQQSGNNSTTSAEEEGPSPEEQFKQLFMAVDKDANGKISAPEALAFWEEKAKTMDQGELQKKLDKFNAKTLSEAVERGFKKVDKDADGAVTPDELKAYLQS